MVNHLKVTITVECPFCVWYAINRACLTTTPAATIFRITSAPAEPLHFLCTQCEQPEQNIELLPTPFLQTPHRYLPESFKVCKLNTCHNFSLSHVYSQSFLLHFNLPLIVSFLLRSSSVSATITRSSA